MKRMFKNTEGTTTIEAALIFPVFLFFIFATIYYSYAMMLQNNMQYGIQSAARYRLINASATPDDLIQVAKNNMTAVDTENVTVNVSSQTVNGINSLVITATYNFALVDILNADSLNVTTNITVPI